MLPPSMDRCGIRPYYKSRRKGGMNVVWLLIILGIWVLLQTVILPRLGVST
jgi:hypothetical protein